MKICILTSSYTGTGSSYKEFDEYQNPGNPGIYVKSHQFEQRFVTKENACEIIDQIIQEGFDYIWNFMWGPVDENIAGVSATKYLESKRVPMIGTSSKFLSLTKLDYKNAFTSAQIKTPRGIEITGCEDSINNLDLSDLTFPLIVKPSVGYGSKYMTPESVCRDYSELMEQIKILKLKTTYKIMIEEFIDGEECSVIILETKNGVIALKPLIYVFPNERKLTETFLDFESKFNGIERDEITYKIFDEDSSLANKIEEAGVKAYGALGVLGSGYARVNFRLKGTELYVFEVNRTPAFFFKLGNKFGDDFIIQSTFPGGHEGLVGTIISSKMRLDTVVREYDNMASTYNELLNRIGSNHTLIWRNMIKTFDFAGKVLDLGCGTGVLGNIIHEKYKSIITGVDVSAKMIELVKDYEKVHIGLIENIILDLNSTYNHVVTSGALSFVDKRHYEKILSRMFGIAVNSISLTVEDFSEEYHLTSAKSYAASLFNHMDTIEKFQIPSGWCLVYKKREYFWKSPRTGLKVYGLMLRYEKETQKVLTV